MTTRRRFLGAVVCGLAIVPIAVLAQTRKMPRVGFVLTTAPLPTMAGAEPEETVMRGFVHGLRSLGYIEGQNIALERRSAEGQPERLEGLIRGLADAPVDVIVVTGNHMTLLAKKVTATVPIVVAGMGPPVELGIAQSVTRPGGNITGLFSALGNPDFVAKRLEIVREMLPRASRIAFLGSKEDWATEATAARTAAKAMGLTMVFAEVEMPRIQAALELVERRPPDALLVSSAPPFFVHRKLIADFAARVRVPDFHAYHQAVEVGALASYGHDAYDIFRRTAGYVDRILKGAKVGDLPMEHMDRYALVVNLKTAKSFGFTIPQSVLSRADRVIE